MKKKYLLYGLLSIFIIFLALVNPKPFAIGVVNGSSMEKTYKHGDWVPLIKGSVTKGDVVSIIAPESWKMQEVVLLKRVIADEGDFLKITQESLLVNDELIVNPPQHWNVTPIEMVVPDGYVFVMGDNFQVSFDSFSQYRFYGEDFLIPKENIDYKALFGSTPVYE